MSRVASVIAAIKEDRRSNYLWDTKPAAEVVGLVPNKFGTWWYENRRKLVALATAFPGQTSAELMAVIAEATDELERMK